MPKTSAATIPALDEVSAPRRSGVTGSSYLLTALLIVVAAAVLLPIVVLIVKSLEVPLDAGLEVRYGLEGWISAFSDSSVLSALGNTLSLTLAHQAISLPIGIMVSWLIARTDMPGSRWLEFGFWISFFLPPLSVVQAWILLLAPDYGLVNRALRAAMPGVLPGETGPFDLYSYWGIVFAHLATTTISAKVMLLTPAFRNMDSSLEEAAYVAGQGRLGTLLYILIPIMAPAILATGVMGLIRALEAFEIELVLGGPARIDVYSTLIYRYIRSEPPAYGPASALGLAVIMGLTLVALLPRLLMAGKRYTTLSGRGKLELTRLGGWRWVAFGFVTALVALLTGVPFALLLVGTFMRYFGFFGLPAAWTFEHWVAVLYDPIFLSSLWNTLIIALGVAVFTVGLSVGLAYVITRTRFWGRTLLDLLTWVPFTMPGVLFSLAILWLTLEVWLFRPAYGTTFLLVAVVGLSMLTLGVQIVKSTFLQIGDDLEAASWACGASRFATLRKIVIPLAFNAIAVVGIMGFIAAARNVALLALLSSSDNRPLAILQLEYMAEGSYERASVIGFIIACVTVGVAFAARAYGLQIGPKMRAGGA